MTAHYMQNMQYMHHMHHMHFICNCDADMATSTRTAKGHAQGGRLA